MLSRRISRSCTVCVRGLAATALARRPSRAPCALRLGAFARVLAANLLRPPRAPAAPSGAAAFHRTGTWRPPPSPRCARRPTRACDRRSSSAFATWSRVRSIRSSLSSMSTKPRDTTSGRAGEAGWCSCPSAGSRRPCRPTPGACGRAARRGRRRRRRGRRRTRSRHSMRSPKFASLCASISSTSPSVMMNVSVPWFERLGDLRVQHHVAVLAVDRHEVLRPHQRLHDLQLFLRGVAAHVDVGDAVVEHVRAEPEQVVDRAVHQRLVAGNGRRRQDHRDRPRRS